MEWKIIENYPNYAVSNDGLVKNIKTNRLLKYWKNNDGYLLVCLCNQLGKRTLRVHRLVAQTFISNINNLPEVNHIDENKENNIVSNLEWCTAKYNSNYGTRTKRMSETKKLSVIQCSLDGKLILKWDSIKEAGETLHIDKGNISKCCKGKIKSAGKFIWNYL